MIYLDTNILVRLIVGDTPAQSTSAARLFDRFGDELYLPPPVFTETAFVLLKVYGLSQAKVAEALALIIGQLHSAPAERQRMMDALNIFSMRRVDMVDAWLAAETVALGHQVATFDGDLRKCGANVIDPLTV